MRSARVLGLVCLWLCTASPSGSREAEEREGGWAVRGREVVRLVREHFFDQNAAEAWARKHAAYYRRAETEESFVTSTNQALDELGASHTGFFTPRDAQYHGLLAIFARALEAGEVAWDSPGADFDGDHFVRVVFVGGPAEEAGLRRGDRILKADGEEFHPVESFRGRAGQTVALTVQRHRDQPPFEIKLIPRRINPKVEWLEAIRQGAEIITRNGREVGYVPLYSCAGEEFENALKEMLSGPLRDAEALILDFRDGFGGCHPSFVNLFDSTPAILTYVGRDKTERRFDAQWRKPLWVLINGGSRSGKEVVAHSIKHHRLGTLVGTRTAGAVVAGRSFLLSDRSLLYLAVYDILVDGRRLEGRGVEPDVEVMDALPYANGADPQLETALEIATR